MHETVHLKGGIRKYLQDLAHQAALRKSNEAYAEWKGHKPQTFEES